MYVDQNNIITGNAKVLRGANRRTILNMIRVMQPISRINLARYIGLNRSTISSIVSELLEEELIYETVNEDGNIGRNPLNLHLKLGKYFVGAINFDLINTHLAITDIDGSVIGLESIKTDSGNAKKFVETSMNKLMEMSKKLNIEELKAVGISVAGIVDSKRLTVNFAPNLNWSDFNIGECISSMNLNIGSVAISNAAKSSALAELWFGTHNIKLANFVFLSVGAGIGSGIVVEGRLLEGEFNAAGEFGHMTIYENGILCSCGNYGCLEAYASDRAVVKRYIARLRSNNGETTDILMKDIIALSQNGDELAIQMIKETGYFLGLGISKIIKAIDPHAIIISGKITQVWNLIEPEINKIIQKRAYFGKKKKIEILPTSLTIRPHLLGAAAIALRKIFEGYKITA